MTGLALSLQPKPFEPAISIASRIAMKLCVPSVSDCLRDLGVNWPLFRSGQPKEIEHFAEIIDTDGATLLHESLTPRSRGQFSFRGHILDRRTVNRRDVKLCPRCIMEDHERSGPVGRYGRTYWQLTQFRTCPRHAVPLISLPQTPASQYVLDFARVVERNFATVQRVADAATSRPHGFESWLLHRLTRQSSPHWLDRQEVSVIAQICERAGAVLCFGATTAPRRLSEEQLATATEAAFQKLISTDDGFTPLLQEIWDACPSTRPGYYPALGNLWIWLDKAKGDPRYERVLHDTADFIFSHQAIPSGTKLLGQICKQRRCHSVQSAAETYGLNISRTDRLLKTLVREGQDLAVDAVDPILSRISACIPRVRAAKHLGVSPDIFDRLKRGGQVNAAFRGEKVADLYDIKELDRLRHAVFSRAQAVHKRPPNSSRVAAAVRLVSVTCEEILAMIAEGKLVFVGQEPGNHNMCDLYVNRDELRDLVYGPEEPLPEDHFTINQARAVLYLNTMTIAWFMREGYLRAAPHWNARQRRHSRLIAQAELEAFADQYVSLGALAAEARIQANHVARRLERNGIIPLDFLAHLNKIFLREAVQPPEHVGRPLR
ncbi:TniQ family protein [Paracoccus sp. J56]|uniref:TniQ family protein n=1 Tax=Paracoccus sp. J56 TaxID=935850 RepID=UPI000A0E34CC|nr:TniQ family protein [Paracoccus sp. J56]SMG56120.1 TniQ protein [Paracoccus sp. J56]